MGIENYRQQIDEIFLVYINDLKPLIAMVEHNYRKFPKGILKEFRDVFDHISRLYIKNNSEEYYTENLNKAINHFDRLKLDVYKYVCDLKKKQIDKWIHQYSKYDMCRIDNGEFWKDVIAKFDDCEETFCIGQEQECLDIRKACVHYEQYAIKCDAVFEFIKNKSSLIRDVKYKYYKTAIKGVLGGLALGIIGSIIASMIWVKAIEPVIKAANSNNAAVDSTTQTIVTEEGITFQ